MSETKHTPGPWEWVGGYLESNAPGHINAVLETRVSCGQFCYGGSVDMTISDADARLISAAPDLFEALQLCYDHCRLYHREVESNNVGEAVRAAIAKALGEQS